MRKQTLYWMVVGLIAQFTAVPAWSVLEQPLPLVVTPTSGTQVISGQTFVVRMEAAVPVGKMDVRVSAYGNSQNRYGYSPMEFTLTVPWQTTGPYEVGVYAQSYDRQTDTIYVGEEELKLFAMPDPAEVPVGFDRISSIFLKAPASGQRAETKDISPRARYADQRARGVKLGVFGTTYVSSDPAVATVDGDGKVTPVAPGTAYVEVGYLGVKEFVEITVKDPTTGRAPLYEYTDLVPLTVSGFRRDPATGLFVQQISFSNPTEWPIPKPISLVVNGLPEGVEIASVHDKTDHVEPLRSPSVGLSIEGDFLRPGATATVTLKFRNDQNLPINYTLRLFGADFP